MGDLARFKLYLLLALVVIAVLAMAIYHLTTRIEELKEWIRHVSRDRTTQFEHILVDLVHTRRQLDVLFVLCFITPMPHCLLLTLSGYVLLFDLQLHIERCAGRQIDAETGEKASWTNRHAAERNQLDRLIAQAKYLMCHALALGLVIKNEALEE